jgi:hypothetical protein
MQDTKNALDVPVRTPNYHITKRQLPDSCCIISRFSTTSGHIYTYVTRSGDHSHMKTPIKQASCHLELMPFPKPQPYMYCE